MGCGAMAVAVREELPMTVEQFAERIKKYYKNQKGSVYASMVVYYVDQLLKEHNERSDKDGGEKNVFQEDN